jgi:hypothetical protein
MFRYGVIITMLAVLILLFNTRLFAQSPGVQVGTTWYDMQSVGPIGNRMVICEDGSWWGCYTALMNIPYPPTPRYIFCIGNHPGSDSIFVNQITQPPDAAEPNIDAIYSNMITISYIEYETGVSLFINTDPHGYYDPPDSIPYGLGYSIWPHVAVDQSNHIHIVSTEAASRRIYRLAYTRSHDGGNTWAPLIALDTIMVPGNMIDASPVSDRLAIAYCMPLDTTSFWNNDIVLIDMGNFTFNITDYDNDDDSLWARNDLDLAIDHDDYVHVIWGAQWVTDQVYAPTYLFHYSEQTGEINEITHHPESQFPDISGGWNRPVCNLNMGIYEIVDGPDAIFVTWTQYDTTDVSAGGYGNGDIYMSYSIDNGTSWTEPQNLTNSHSPGCYPGDCDSDHWGSIADAVNDSLRILYLNDKDAGSYIMDEGVPTENPVMYLAAPNPLTSGIGTDEYALPKNLSLDQNYPNPFNESTTISFSIQQTGKVKLEIFDITGAFVQTLLDETLPAGEHHIAWNAADLASGTYLYKLTLSGKTTVRKAVLIK